MQAPLLRREKWLIIGALLGLSLMAWLLTAYQVGGHAVPGAPVGGALGQPQGHGGMAMEGGPHAGRGDRSSWGATAAQAILFLAMWLAMMVAMMLPSVAPMVLLFARVSKGQAVQTGMAPVPTWLFVAGYLVVWTLVGAAMYPASLGAGWLGAQALGGSWRALGSGGALIVAGLYQFSRWKGVCLGHCRSPLSFVLHRWREGAAGALRMGIDHGAYCVGCCWGLMLVMFAMGLMSLAWMGLLTAVIFVEKLTPSGPLLGKGVGAILIALGTAILLDPSVLPRLSG
jgi:predicted metal-binding membrane protein